MRETSSKQRILTRHAQFGFAPRMEDSIALTQLPRCSGVSITAR